MTVPPGGQSSIAMEFNPSGVVITNGSGAMSANIVYVWVYPAQISVTPTALSLDPAGSSMLAPPAPQFDPNGDMFNVKTLVIYNTGAAKVSARLQ